ncbi:MAG TPA: glycosyltransferase family 39 protein [Polyangiaceae bacterium]
MHEFDVWKHQPHPPGYPLWIVVLKAVHLVVSDLNLAQELLDFAITLTATVVFYRCAVRLHGRPAALLASALLLFSPTVVFYGSIASTYPVDLLTSALVGSLALRAWQGDARAGGWAVFATALLAGVRESGAVMMAPLLAAGLIRAYGRDVRAWLVSLAVGVGTLAAWYVPTGISQGGVVPYTLFSGRVIRGYFADMSVLYGAPAEAHLAMLRNVATWTCAMLIVAAVATAIIWKTARMVGGVTTANAAAASQGVAFFAFWIVPDALYVTLFHAPKPGYLLLLLPPFLLIAARASSPALEALGARLRVTALSIAACWACVTAAASTALASAPYSNAALGRDSLASARDSDRDTDALERLVSTAAGSSDTLIVVFDKVWSHGPNVKSLMLDLPETRIAALWADGSAGLLREFRRLRFWDDRAERKELAPGIRTVLWVDLPGAPLPPWLSASFSDAHRVYAGRTVTVFRTDVGDRPFEATVVRDGHSFHLGRYPPRFMETLLEVSRGDAHFGAGWYGVDVSSDPAQPLRSARGEAPQAWRWMGATGEIDVMPASTSRAVLVKLEGFVPVGALSGPPTLTFTLDGTSVDSFVAPSGVFRRAWRVALPVKKGQEMKLVIATSATGTAPPDPRPLGFALTALSFRPDDP